MKVDWLIIGAGYTGAVLAERIASQLDQSVLVVDRRDHIAGNAFDCYDDQGVLVHKYGAHIFHTNSAKIYEYLSQFTAWRPYQHHVRAVIEGKTVPVPFNLNTLEALFPRTMSRRIERLLIEKFGFGAKVPVLKMLEENDPDLRELARYVYRNVFQSYTIKQWGLKPEELDASVTGRVPVVIGRDDRYFQDEFQVMPKHGYTELFRRMLAHPNIRLLLKTNHREAIEGVRFKRLVFTGPIDQYFDHIHGPLPYRSLRFEFRHQPAGLFQAAPVINYPNEHNFTRIIEFKQLTGQTLRGTTVAYEYPEAYEHGINEPYYPVPREDNRDRYALYLREAQRLNGAVIFAGRLADYKYYNMDQAVGRALKVFDEQIAHGKREYVADAVSA